ncbi:MAG TPA: hypothetical protein VN723_15765 [Rhizomicrobium sp.]|jgi:hypothetical protein|nr:hypothetical protein [Rhizomicrobium sp.]
MYRLKFLLLAASLAALPLVAQAATPAVVQAQQSPAMPGPDAGRHHGGKLAAFLSPEQRAAFMLKAREETRDISHDQRRAWRADQVQKLSAMSDTDKQKLKADLQARWDALPADRKARIEQRLAERNGPPPAQ